MKLKFTLKHIALLMIYISCQFLFHSCKQPTDYVPPPTTIKCDSANTVLIPEDMKARFYFKAGTYWIYKNFSTGETDSMWAYTSNCGVGPVNKKIHAYGWNKCYETFSIKIFNRNYNYIYYDIMQYPINGFNPSIETFQLQQISPVNNNKGSYHIGIKGQVYFNDQGAEINDFDSIITSENLVYKNILNVFYPSGTSNDIFSNMYYAKNIGLVKFERSTDNSIWELIRNNINQ